MKQPILTASHVTMLTNGHMNHRQYQLVTGQGSVTQTLKNINRLDLISDASLLYVVTSEDENYDEFDSTIIEAWYCCDPRPADYTTVHLAYRVE